MRYQQKRSYQLDSNANCNLATKGDVGKITTTMPTQIGTAKEGTYLHSESKGTVLFNGNEIPVMVVDQEELSNPILSYIVHVIHFPGGHPSKYWWF